ncbi:MAG: 4Fe-4S binding protein [Candidatus Altiarchaeota archaeon]
MDVDRQICCYCGGCVGVCPQDALTLEDTSLQVDERCNDCGICVIFCPVRALSIKK